MKEYAESINTYFKRGDKLQKEGKLTRAINYYQEALRLDSNAIRVLGRLAEIYQSQNELSQAINYYQRIIQLMPNDSDTYLKMASLMLRQKNFQGAIDNYNKAITIQPEQPAWPYIGLGDALNSNNQINEALKAFQNAIEIDPNNGLAHSKLAKVLANQGNEQEAIGYYQKAFVLQPKQPFWVYSSFADILYKNNQIDQTISICQQALDLKPNNLPIHLFLAKAQEKKGDIDAAIASYQKVIKLNPQQTFAVYRSLGNLQVEKENYQSAIDSYVKCLKINHKWFTNYAHLDETLCNLYGTEPSSLLQNINDLFEGDNHEETAVIQELQSHLKFGFLGQKGATVDPLSYYLINHQLKIVYCSIPKNACTVFKNFIVDNSDSKEEFDKLSQNIHQFLATKKTNILSLTSCLESPDYFKFLILRNPFARLASAYLDKFAKHLFPESFARDVIREVQQFLGVEVNIKKSITFAQFIKYLARTKDRDLNDHWRPQSNFLGSVKFDLVGQFENLDVVFNLLQKKYSISIRKKVSAHMTNYKDFSNNLEFHQIYPYKLRTLDAMPTAWNLYNSELEAIVRERYAKDIEIYEQYFNVSLDNLQT